MLLTIQAFVEDFINSRGWEDTDGYGVQLSRMYFYSRRALDEQTFLTKMHRVRTIFFARNGISERAIFEQKLLRRLDSKFKKKLWALTNPGFPGGVEEEKAKLGRLKRRTISEILRLFKHGVESRGVETFWLSRKKGKLKERPEDIAQGLLALFLVGTLGKTSQIHR